MTFGDVLNSLRRFWLVVVAFTIAALVIAVAAATLPETKYEARATLLAQPDTDRVDFAAVEAVRFLLPSLAELVSTNTFRGEVGDQFDPPLPASAVDTQADFEPGTGIVHVTGVDASAERAQNVTQVAAILLGQQQLSEAVVINVLDPPELPTAPVGPGTRAYLVGGLVLGLLGGALLAILLGAAARARDLTLPAPDQSAQGASGGADPVSPTVTETEGALLAAETPPSTDREPESSADRAGIRATPEAEHELAPSASTSDAEAAFSDAAAVADVATPTASPSPAGLLHARLGELEVPVLGSIPVKAPPARSGQNGSHGFDDAFRALAGRLTTLTPDQRQLLFTSPRDGMGRTTVVANTVWALATSGSPVVAIDADIDNPMLHRFLRTPSEPGLTDLTRVGIDAATHVSSVPALSVVPAGGAHAAAAEIALDAVPSLLGAIGERFALVDGPPLTDPAGAAALARGMRGVVLVIDAADPRAPDDVGAAASAAAGLGVELVGVVVNRASH